MYEVEASGDEPYMRSLSEAGEDLRDEAWSMATTLDTWDLIPNPADGAGNGVFPLFNPSDTSIPQDGMSPIIANASMGLTLEELDVFETKAKSS